MSRPGSDLNVPTVRAAEPTAEADRGRHPGFPSFNRELREKLRDAVQTKRERLLKPPAEEEEAA
jgi:hypothetical protein